MKAVTIFFLGRSNPRISVKRGISSRGRPGYPQTNKLKEISDFELKNK